MRILTTNDGKFYDGFLKPLPTSTNLGDIKLDRGFLPVEVFEGIVKDSFDVDDGREFSTVIQHPSHFRLSVFPAQQSQQLDIKFGYQGSFSQSTNKAAFQDSAHIERLLNSVETVRGAGLVDVESCCGKKEIKVRFREPGQRSLIISSNPHVKVVRIKEGTDSEQEEQALIPSRVLAQVELTEEITIRRNAYMTAHDAFEELVISGDGITGLFALQCVETEKTSRYLSVKASAWEVECALNNIWPNTYCVTKPSAKRWQILGSQNRDGAKLRVLGLLRSPTGVRGALDLRSLVGYCSNEFILRLERKNGSHFEFVQDASFSLSANLTDTQFADQYVFDEPPAPHPGDPNPDQAIVEPIQVIPISNGGDSGGDGNAVYIQSRRSAVLRIGYPGVLGVLDGNNKVFQFADSFQDIEVLGVTKNDNSMPVGDEWVWDPDSKTLTFAQAPQPEEKVIITISAKIV